mmetsp:Transcript_102089/g.287008  ORF Transcript_102089/g.287008 Transcript_102089/m.287008 type:complete len:359 (+) Transcript_102089:127-1203(+)
MSRSLEEECGVARRVDCNPSPRGAVFGPGDPFALPSAGAGSNHPLTKPRNANQELFFAAYLPFFLFILVVASFTLALHVMPVLPWMVVAVSADILAVGNWPTRGRGHLGKVSALDWLPFGIAFLTIGCAVVLGTCNASVVEPWIAASKFTEHSGVLPSDSGEAYADAGILHFAEGAQLDVESAAGFEAWPNVYCAAPIFDKGGPPSNASSDAGKAQVSFWAIGRNCCNSRGGFTCGDVSDPSVSSGLHAIAQQGDPMYIAAVRMAAAANDFVPAPDLVLVLWQKNPQARADRAWWLSTCILVVSCLLAIALCVVAQYLLRKLLGFATTGGLALPLAGRSGTQHFGTGNPAVSGSWRPQ